MFRSKLTMLLLVTLLSACGQVPGLMGPGAYLPNEAYPDMQTQFSDANYYGDANRFDTNTYPTSSYPDSSVYPDSYANSGFVGAPNALDNSGLPVTSEPGVGSDTDPAPPPMAVARPEPVTAQLSILSFNIWALPGFLGVEREERLARLAETLQGYDIVALQEAFTDDVGILKKLAGFSHHVPPPKTSFFQMNSGLYVLSRYPVIKTEFRSFGRCTGKDCLVDKGVLLVRVQHPELGPVDLITTHYQSGQNEASEAIRSEDNNEQLDLLLRNNLGPYPMILAGDFNFLPDQAAYQDLHARFPLVDTFRTLYPDQPGYTVDPMNQHAKGQMPARSDYIFGIRRENQEIQVLQADVRYQNPVRGMQLSDQFGISAQLKITLTPPAVLR